MRRHLRHLKFSKNSTLDPIIELTEFPFLPRSKPNIKFNLVNEKYILLTT